jgi:hypothetical protein
MAAHNMIGQRCAYTPGGHFEACGNEATWVYFGTQKDSEDVCYTFLCGDCVRTQEEVSGDPKYVHEGCPVGCFA